MNYKQFLKKIAKTLTKRLLRNPTKTNERTYDNFMDELTPLQRKQVLRDGEVKTNLKIINQLGGLR